MTPMLCSVTAQAAAPAPAKAAAPAAAPAASDAADLMDEAEKPQKKEKHPLAVLDTEQPTAFVLDDWKRNISNCNGDYAGAMQTFWSTFDAAGWSLWLSKYKYNDENKRMFMTCNAVSGFIQRTDALRKWAFGVMHITGEEGSAIEISGCWLLRGQSAEYMLAENPDAEYYDWVKLDPTTQRSVVDEFWSKSDGMQLEGKVIAETKSFK
jgi:elongation factor 1-gamma